MADKAEQWVAKNGGGNRCSPLQPTGQEGPSVVMLAPFCL
jgi:hypothetical protein